LFWFHPLAWVLERRLALLAERACDESCVAALGDRNRYARLLLEMASAVDGSQGRLRSHALTMAAGPHIRQRIDALLEDGRTFSQGLSWTAWVAVALCGLPLVWGAGAVELDRQPPLLQLAMPRWSVPAPPVHVAQAQTAPAQAAAPQSTPAPRPKFDVASIRPCSPGDGGGKSGGRGGKGGGGGRYLGRSPGRFNVTCMSVVDLIDIAYVQFGDPLENDDMLPLLIERTRGGPGWARSDRYTIHAETEDRIANGPTEGNSPAFRRMAGPMLQALLEDRFQLKTHREVEEAPMYALTLAKSGLKLKPVEEGDCLPDGPPEWPKGGKPPCRWIGWGANGPNRMLLAGGVPFKQLALALGGFFLDRHVIDRTGVTESFNIRVEFAPDENTPNKFNDPRLEVDPTSDIPLGASIFTALAQVGLKLEPIKAPRGFIVMDHVERPSEN
jgi:uncharacterized protein (TIGR03435 family)